MFVVSVFHSIVPFYVNSLKSFIIFYFPFNVNMVYINSSFSLLVLVICAFPDIFLVSLWEFCQFYWFFQRISFWFDFSHFFQFYSFLFFIIFLFLLALDFAFLFVFILYGRIKDNSFSLSTVLVVPHKFW